MPVSVQSRFSLQSGNVVIIFIDPDGEVTMNFSSNPTKADKQEAEMRVPEAIAEGGERSRLKGESEE